MLDYKTEDTELIFGTYGHSYTLDEIKNKYPYEDQKKFKRKKYERMPNARISYDPLGNANAAKRYAQYSMGATGIR